MVNIYNDKVIPKIKLIEEFDEIPLTRYQAVKIIKLYDMKDVSDMYRYKKCRYPLYVFYREPITVFMMKPPNHKIFRYFMKIALNQPVDDAFVNDVENVVEFADKIFN